MPAPFVFLVQKAAGIAVEGALAEAVDGQRSAGGAISFPRDDP